MKLHGTSPWHRWIVAVARCSDKREAPRDKPVVSKGAVVLNRSVAPTDLWDPTGSYALHSLSHNPENITATRPE